MFQYVVGGFVDVWMDVSVGGWYLGGCMDGCVNKCLVVGWMCESISVGGGGGWVDGLKDVSFLGGGFVGVWKVVSDGG